MRFTDCKSLKTILNVLRKVKLILPLKIIHLDKLLTHHKDEKLRKTNNVEENINLRLMIRFKIIETFKNFNIAENYLILKPYKDIKSRSKNKSKSKSKSKSKNGKSHLEVYGVVLKSKDCLKNAVTF